MENNYSKALKEVYILLQHVEKETKNKIPKDMQELIEKNMDKEYIFKFNEGASLSEQKFSNEALGLISVLYSKYICNEEERKKWNEFDKFYNDKMKELKKKK